MQYIATRPVCRSTEAMACSVLPPVDLALAMSELEAHEGNRRTIILFGHLGMLPRLNTTTPMRGARSSWRTHAKVNENIAR